MKADHSFSQTSGSTNHTGRPEPPRPKLSASVQCGSCLAVGNLESKAIVRSQSCQIVRLDNHAKSHVRTHLLEPSRPLWNLLILNPIQASQKVNIDIGDGPSNGYRSIDGCSQGYELSAKFSPQQGKTTRLRGLMGYRLTSTSRKIQPVQIRLRPPKLGRRDTC